MRSSNGRANFIDAWELVASTSKDEEKLSEESSFFSSESESNFSESGSTSEYESISSEEDEPENHRELSIAKTIEEAKQEEENTAVYSDFEANKKDLRKQSRDRDAENADKLASKMHRFEKSQTNVTKSEYLTLNLFKREPDNQHRRQTRGRNNKLNVEIVDIDNEQTASVVYRKK